MKTIELPKRVELPMRYDEWLESLAAKGWVQISRATYARVFAHPNKPGRVLKVARDDSAYDTFLSMALAYPNNPFFPKIFNVQRFTLQREWAVVSFTNVTVVEMERLTVKLPLTRADHNWRYAMEGYAEGWRGKVWRSKWEQQAGDVLRKLFSLERPDLHAGNVMFRGNHPVITDPVF